MENFYEKNFKILERLYDGICNIYEYRSFKNEKTKATKNDLILIYKNIPCRASYYNNSSNIVSSKESIFNNTIKQNVKLFLNNKITIKAGSVIIITQNGKTTKYKNSGEPIIYSSHQELMMDIFDDIG